MPPTNHDLPTTKKKLSILRELLLISVFALAASCGGTNSNTNPDTDPDTTSDTDSDSDTDTDTDTNNDSVDSTDNDDTTSDTDSGSFSLSSAAIKSNNILPTSAICDGLGEMIPLAWTNAPDAAESFIVTMITYPNPNDEGDLSFASSQIVLYDIASDQVALAAGDTSNATVASSYNCPNSADTEEHSYIVTLYATSLATGQITINSSSSDSELVQVYNQISSNILEQDTLTLTRIRYNPNDTNHEPTEALDTCTEKEAAFEAYSDLVSISSCSDSGNLILTSSTGRPERSDLDEDKPNVGITSWIGRVNIDGESSWTIPVAPTYVTTVTSSNWITIRDPIGVTVSGVPILHYAKEGADGDQTADPTADLSASDTMLLGEVDQCGGHGGNGDDYHLHGAPICMMDTHDVSMPVAFMMDGIPLYFGTGGGVLTDGVDINYGGGRYSDERYDYRPSDVKTGAASLDDCNAYELSTGTYIYYTSAEAPYTIGCFRGEDTQDDNASATLDPIQENSQLSWSGADVELTDYGTTEYDSYTWYYVDATPGDNNNQLSTVGRVLYRALESDEEGYSDSETCYTFIYRTDKTDETGASDSTSTPSTCR